MNPPIGLYEKALPAHLDWYRRLDLVAELGFDFLEIAVDPSPERLARLDWSPARRAELRDAIARSGIPVATIVLSAHRSHALGSRSATTRKRALDILDQAIELAVDTGVRTVQLAGYFVFEEPHWSGARAAYLRGLTAGAELASRSGVMLGIENVDGRDVTSVGAALEFITEVRSPWLQLYPDIGNLTANGFAVESELNTARGHIVGVHLKDTLPGVFRRVPFGAGTVPFAAAFRCLAEMRYPGPYAIEMWNEETDAAQTASRARTWIVERMVEAGLATSSQGRDGVSENDRPPP